MQYYQPYLEWLDHQTSHMSERVQQWANSNSYTFNTRGLEEMLTALEKDFSPLQGTVEKRALPPFETIDDRGNHITSSLGKALHITKRPEAPFHLFLGGHMDTVFPPTSPFQSVSVTANRLIGPGVVDMKGGLVIMLYALQAFEKSPFCKNIGWEILINPDEEVGSYGSKELLFQCAKNNQLGLLFEPSFPDGNVVSSRGSSMNLIVVVRGKAAHVGRDFEKGKSAAFIQASLVVELEKLNNSKEEAIVNVGQITSGHGFNIVPDVAVIKINIRTTTTEHLHTIKKRIEVLIEAHKQQRAVDIELHEHTLNEAKPCTEKTQHVLELFKQCADALHMPFGWKSTHGVSDGNKLAQWGLPCIDSLGAIGGGLHTYDEYLETYSLLERSKLCALFLMKLGNSEIAL